MSLPYLQFYVGDYLRDTMHLSCEEHGAYTLLLFSMFARRGRLPNDEKALARICRLTPTRFRSAWKAIGGYFFTDGDSIGSKRLDMQLEHSATVSEARANARRGKRKSKKFDRNLNENGSAKEAKSNVESQQKQGDAKSIDNQTTLTRVQKDKDIASNEAIYPYPPLSEDGREAFARLLDAAANVPAHDVEIRRLVDDIRGFHDGNLIVGGRYAVDRYSQSLREPLRAAGLRLTLPPPSPPEDASNVIPLAKAG